jgi:hypothetical protein
MGFGNTLADYRDMGGGESTCNLTAEGGKFTAQISSGVGAFPVLPGSQTVDLEGGAKAVVKPSGIASQNWANSVIFPNATVSFLIAGEGAVLDPDKKIAELKKADGSTITFEDAYMAFAKAIGHNAASGAPPPSSVTNIGAKGDPCALVTTDEVKSVLKEFTVNEPEKGPSAFGGEMCRFRVHSDSLATTALVNVVYLTEQQFQSATGMAGTNGTQLQFGNVTANQYGGLVLMKKGDTYVRLEVVPIPDDASHMDQIGEGMRHWSPDLAAKIAAHM